MLESTVPWPKGQAVHAAEHHSFTFRGTHLLFSPRTMAVLPIDPIDKWLVEQLADPRLPEDMLPLPTAEAPMPIEAVNLRLVRLWEAGFLQTAQAEPPLAPEATGGGHITVMVNVTQQCNLTCSYCYVNQGRFDYPSEPQQRMSPTFGEKIARKVFDLLPDFEVYAFHFYGGEPLLNFVTIRRIVDAAEDEARQRGLGTEFHITTNGTILSEPIAQFMDDHRFTVYFSIDGNQSTHDEYRRYRDGRGSYDDVLRNLERLRNRPRIHLIGSTVVRRDLPLGEAMHHLATCGAKQCKAERVRLGADNDLRLGSGDHELYLQDIGALVEHYIEALSAGRKPMDFRLSSKILQLLTRRRRTFFCPAGERMFGIASNGEIYPCALHVGRPQSLLGNARNNLDPDAQTAFRARFGADSRQPCLSCWNRYLCGGGCSAMVDRFGQDDCLSLKAETEAAIAVYNHFLERDPAQLYGLVSPKLVAWINGEADGLNPLTNVSDSSESASASISTEHAQE